jgi:hypothetical protein
MKLWRAYCADSRVVDHLGEGDAERFAASKADLYAQIRGVTKTAFEVETAHDSEAYEHTPDTSPLEWSVRTYELGAPSVRLVLAAFRRAGYSKGRLASYKVAVDAEGVLREMHTGAELA